jgi:hypothetical protein
MKFDWMTGDQVNGSFHSLGDQRQVDLERPADEAPEPACRPAPPSSTPSEDAPPIVDTPSSSTAPTLSGLGTTFNNAIQSAVSSLPQTRLPKHQETGGVNNSASELTAVHNSLLTEVSRGQLSGAALGHVQAILSDINAAISTANATAISAAAIGNQPPRNNRFAPAIWTSQHRQYGQGRCRAANLAVNSAPTVVPEPARAAKSRERSARSSMTWPATSSAA